MIRPANICKGDKIGIVAPARFVPEDKYLAICQFIEEQGFVPVLGQTTHLAHGIFAGTDAERATDFQSMIDNDDIKAILCVRGGYGCIRIIDKLNFEPLLKNPKWIAGFSDVTVLHSALSRLGVASLHGQMPVNFTKENSSADALFRAMQGNQCSYTFCGDGNRQGSAEAEVVGGNLSILCSLMGTPYQLDTDNKILFIEDVCEPLYRIDRMMQQLKVAGVLEHLAGLVVGYFTDAEDSTPAFEMSVEQIVMDSVSVYGYPVAFGFQAGHQQPNLPLLFGCKATLEVGATTSKLAFL